MSSREKIMARVREALSVPTIRTETHEGPVIDSSYADQMVDHEPRTHWMRDPGETVEEQWSLFKELSAKLKTEIHEVASLEEARRLFDDLVNKEDWKTVATHQGELTDALRASDACAWMDTDGGYDVHAMEACQAGISECEVLIAQTGSVLITSRSSGGRSLSILPPHHVVIARKSQLVPDLAVGYACLKETYGGRYPSLISFITGPSRTGDIERTLVLGAHGPKRLSIILIET